MADVIFNRPLQNEDLEATLDAYEKDVNPETEHDFIAMLGAAQLLAPVQVDAELTDNGDGTFSIDSEVAAQLNYQVIQNQRKKFSSQHLRALKSTTSGQRMLKVLWA